MKKLSIIKICILLSFNAFAQKGNNRLIAEYEDTLKIIDLINAHIIIQKYLIINLMRIMHIQ